MNDQPFIKARVEGDDIVIRCSIKDLIWIVENDPTFKYKVVDPNKFATQMVNELENSESHSNDKGMNAMEELFQNAYQSVYENGDDNTMTGEDIF